MGISTALPSRRETVLLAQVQTVLVLQKSIFFQLLNSIPPERLEAVNGGLLTVRDKLGRPLSNQPKSIPTKEFGYV